MHGVRAAWLKSEAANVQHISFSVSEMTNEKKKDIWEKLVSAVGDSKALQQL